MAAHDFLTVVGSGSVVKQKRVPSSSNTFDFLSVKVGASALEIKETGGHFDFSAKRLTNLAEPTSGSDAATRTFVLSQVAATGTSAEWQASVLDKDLTSPPGAPSTGDRYLIGLDTTASVATGAWAGHDGEIAEWDGAQWVFSAPTTGTFVSADDETSGLYYFGGIEWVFKGFESTTASTGLEKVGLDIRVKFESADPTLETGGSGELKVKLDSAGGIQSGASGLNIKLDGGTLAKGASGLKVADAGITGTQLNTSVAGNGLSGGGGSALSVNVDDSSIEINADSLRVKAAGVTESHLATSVAGDGLAGGGGSALSVNVDNSSIEINTDSLRVKAAGITESHLNTSVAGAGLAGGGGSALSVNTGDGTKIVSDAVVADYSETKTNDNAGSITIRQIVYIKANGNVDLAQATTANLHDFALGVVEDASIATTASGKIYVRKGAVIPGFTGLTPGQHVYVSRSTAGDYTQSLAGFVAGEHIYSVGRAISATQLEFDPQYIMEY